MDKNPSNENPAAADSDPSPTGSPAGAAKRSRRRRWTLAGLAGIAVATVTLGACGGGRWGHGEGEHGHRWHHGAATTAEQAADRVDRGIAWVLKDLDANDVQKQRISEIARQATTELYPMRAAARSARQRAVELLSADTIDAPAIEALRAEQFASLEAASKRISRALVEISTELTPAQRLQLRARIDKRMQRRHG